MHYIFWLSLISIIYTYIGYPILVYLLSLFYKKPLQGKYLYPKVSILMSVYNEEKNIEEKIKTLRELDYPPERLEILIGSDGSTDGTDALIKKIGTVPLEIHKNSPGGESPDFLGGESPYFYRKPQREGKPSMLNFLVSKAKGDILVFNDARQRLDKNALQELVKYFVDPKVGSVSGELIYDDGTGEKSAAGVGLYWEYEKFIRRAESRMGSMLGATGALYAIRRELFCPMPADLILDDIYIPLKTVEKGYRAIFDAKAKVYDKVFASPQDEFLRKTRTLAGNFQLFLYLKELFNPLKGKISWQFFSHKFLRLMVPFLLILMFISNAALIDSYIYRVFFALQIAFYIFAVLGGTLKYKNKAFDVPYIFCLMNAAAVVGLYRFLARKENALWQKAS